MFRPLSLLLLCLCAWLQLATAERFIESKSLNPCMANSKFSASKFHVIFTPDNKTVTISMDGISSIATNITAGVKVIAYGFNLRTEKVSPCDIKELKGSFCPMRVDRISIPFNFPVGDDVIKNIPGVAYTVPDIDGRVQLQLNDSSTGEELACVEADLSNGQTVYHKSIGWVTAVIAGLGLAIAALASRHGHINTSAHVASYAFALFSFFQTQALFGLTAVDLPPIVASWTQNFQWSMGIIRVSFIQDLCTWYQRSTGGKPTTYLSNLSTASVHVQKRAEDAAATSTTQTIVVRGIERVGFRANIESTNIFLTSYIFLVVVVLFTFVIFSLCRFLYVRLIRPRNSEKDKFRDLDWTSTLKGLLIRIILIALPPMSILCFWELSRRDSAAEVVLAIATIIPIICVLVWGCFKVFQLAKYSIRTHGNPAYVLYSDAKSLDRWGALYVQFKASAYYFIAPLLLITLVRGMFIGLGQGSGVLQAIALLILEAGLLVAICVYRPYMDKRTNVLAIITTVVNFLSVVFIMFFSRIFNQPDFVTGIMGVFFAFMNAVFAFILIIIVIASSIRALVSSNPETRYKPMVDDRGSFIKSQAQLVTELDALGAAARGESKEQRHSSFDP